MGMMEEKSRGKLERGETSTGRSEGIDKVSDLR